MSNRTYTPAEQLGMLETAFPDLVRANAPTPRYSTIMEFYAALSRYKRAHDDQLPPEPLHFTIGQWNTFRLDRLALQHIGIGDPKGDRPQTICGLRAEVHADLKGLQRDSCPEEWVA